MVHYRTTRELICIANKNTVIDLTKCKYFTNKIIHKINNIPYWGTLWKAVTVILFNDKLLLCKQ